VRTKSTLLVVISAAIVVTAAAQGPAHPMMTPADMKWGPAPPALPPGGQVAVLDGDPFKPGFFSIRLKMPDGYRIAPHWHPTDENVVVLQGTLGLGMGDTANQATAKALPAGSFTRIPKEMRHYAFAKGETILQIYGEGPFVVNYVNPKDDPSKKPGQ
jgi:hypothetical protein